MIIHQKIAAIMQEMPAIGKDKQNQQQGFKYRSIDDICGYVHGLMKKHNIFFNPHVIESKREILDHIDKRNNQKKGNIFSVLLQVKYDFICPEDGSVLEVGPVVGEAQDYGDKASNKAMSMALKNALLQLFCIPVQDKYDTDKGEDTPKESERKTARPEPTPAEQKILDKIFAGLQRHVKKGYQLKEDGVFDMADILWGFSGRYPQKDEQIPGTVGWLASDTVGALAKLTEKAK